jgi:hypothetical protein
MKKIKNNETLSNDGDLSLEDVIIRSLNKSEFKEKIIELLDYDELYYYVLQAHFDPSVNYTFPNSIIDDLLTNVGEFDIVEQGNYINGSETMYGADPSAYPPDGSWCAELYEFFDHYMWIEPEGEKHGFFSDLKAARNFGNSNYA